MLSVFGDRGDELKKKKKISLACPSVNCTFRKVMCQTPLLRITLGLSGMWLSRGKQVQLGLLVEGKVDGEREGPLSFRVEQMRPGSH